MKIVGIIQARMGSTRLPGKIMKQVRGKSLLDYQLERVQKSNKLDEIIVATTIKGQDDYIVDFCKERNIKVSRGSEDNVLERYYHAAKEANADIVVRMTSDCPLIDPEIIDLVISSYLENSLDYVSNTQIRTYPRGMDTEVFSFSVLEQAFMNAQKEYEKEHVTPYLYLNPNLYSIGQVENDVDLSKYRLTVDTPEDFELISILIEDLYQENKLFGLDKIIQKLEQEPHLFEINKHIEQKKLGDK
ncbi:N-Acetylneuraminate cytidylyltransferase [Bacillus sp. ZZV12-4809]|nr:N-Acetylneuraminate cytidylyltransferase [Bacillus sp. ZZV12-4809]